MPEFEVHAEADEVLVESDRVIAALRGDRVRPAGARDVSLPEVGASAPAVGGGAFWAGSGPPALYSSEFLPAAFMRVGSWPCAIH